MSGSRYLLDTNAIIALLQGNSQLLQLLQNADWIGISIIRFASPCYLNRVCCNLDVSTCNLDVSTCNLDVSTCNLDAPTCNLGVSTCNLDAPTCNLDPE
ncbi:hypothetical protein [Nostoc sp.]|uniref:hypothetical protein n=1 Tax=Nostoc sp. TaxID=1180 RepID=UPI0035947E5A